MKFKAKKKAIINLITGRNTKEKKFKTAGIRCVFLPFGHLLICHLHGLFYVKNDHGVMTYDKGEIFDIYGIKNIEELIKNLSIK